jgi:hypothetical protein
VSLAHGAASTGFCRHCGSQVMVTREGVNHILHLLLTVFLCGLWLFVWIPLAIGGGGPWRCTRCGLVVT